MPPVNEADIDPEGGTKKDDGRSSVVFDLYLHCEKCIVKIKRIVRRFDGVEDVIADPSGNKLTVTGNVDHDKLRDYVAEKTKKKVDFAVENSLYKVFISFRGGDVRSSFTSHLFASLQNAGITVFKDDDSIKRGDQISTSLLRAIEDSRISIVVFSTHYADSRWCLDELVKIMECRKTVGQVVLPVFYGVDPSEVRHQTGEFGNAFQSLLNSNPIGEDESPNQVLTWRAVLRDIAALAGFVVLNSRNESKDIKDIVENVTRLLDKKDLFIANNPVGVESRVQDMIQLLDLDNKQSNDVLLLGMWGMGGVGKTTIAKAIYNKIGRSFESRCFLANIREVWEQNTGQLDLQERLLFN